MKCCVLLENVQFDTNNPLTGNLVCGSDINACSRMRRQVLPQTSWIIKRGYSKKLWIFADIYRTREDSSKHIHQVVKYFAAISRCLFSLKASPLDRCSLLQQRAVFFLQTYNLSCSKPGLLILSMFVFLFTSIAKFSKHYKTAIIVNYYNLDVGLHLLWLCY